MLWKYDFLDRDRVIVIGLSNGGRFCASRCAASPRGRTCCGWLLGAHMLGSYDPRL